MTEMRLKEIVQELREMLQVYVVREKKFHPTRNWKFDFAVPCCKLGIEIGGGGAAGRHMNIGGFQKDMEKYNEAAILGWHLLRFKTSQVSNPTVFYNNLKRYFQNNPCTHSYLRSLYVNIDSNS